MFSFQIEDDLKLVLPTERDAEEIYRVVRENLEELKLWMPWATDDYSLESARVYTRGNLSEFATTGSFSASVVYQEKIVGAIGFHHLDMTNKSAHLGYWLAKAAQGKGLMTKCNRVLIDYLFDEMQLNRVQINCNVENIKSRAIPERLGFKLEGIHQQAKFENNRFTDWAIYAMLAEEWGK
ncbi:MAG: GNAT family N-acetyltransferase [Acidobacteriota bacterium]|nr:GNAT family N-acetyltransferase [Acidobacteriota bacterium]